MHRIAGTVPFIREVVARFDPNDIRKRTTLVLKPNYTQVVGVLGERFSVNLNDHIGWNLYLNGQFDVTPAAVGILFDDLFPGGTFVDIGANIGSSSLVLAKRDIPVLAIEASPFVLHELSQNVALNSPIPYTIVNVAVTSPEHAARESFARIFPAQGNTASSSLVQNWNPSLRKSGSELVHTSTIDDILAFYAINSISVMKLDIEGYEYQALLGAKRTMQQMPVVVFEWRPDVIRKSGNEIDDLRDLFPEGYRFFGLKSRLSSEQEVTFLLSEFALERAYPNVLAVPESRINANPELKTFIEDGDITFTLH